MKKYLLSFGALAVAALSMTSCLSDSHNDQTYRLTYGNTDCFNYVTDHETGESKVVLRPNYTFSLNMTKGELEVEMSNIGLEPSSMRLPALKFTQNANDGLYESKGSDIVPLYASSGTLINSFEFRSLPWRALPTGPIPVYLVNFKVDNRYSVTVYPTTNWYLGRSVATNEADGSAFKFGQDVESYYAVQIRPEKDNDPSKLIATLSVFGAKYTSSMAPFNFYIEKLPVTLGPNGTYRIVSEPGQELQIKRGSDNQVVEGKTVSSLYIVGTLSRGASISYEFNSEDDGNFGVVASDLRYLLYDEKN